MKKSILTIFSLAISTLSVFAQDKVEVTGNVPDLADNTPVYLWNPIAEKYDSTYVKNHSFSISMPMSGGGSTFILQAGIGQKAIDAGYGIALYLEPGKLNISGTPKGFDVLNMKGDAFVKEWVELNRILGSALEDLGKADALNAAIAEASQLGDEEEVKSLSAQKLALAQKAVDICKQYLDTHLNVGASAFVVNGPLAEYLSNEEKLAYLNKFTGNAKHSQVTNKMLAGLTGSNINWIGQQAPNFTQPDANGKMVSLADFKGKYVLVDFWASWCTPCLDEMDALKSAYAKFKDKNFTILSVSLDKDKEKWLKMIAEQQLPWINVSDLKADKNEAAQLYKVLGIPANFLVDPSGKIIGSSYRENMSMDGTGKVLEKALSKLLN